MTQRPFNRQALEKRSLPDKYLEQGYFKTDHVMFDRLLIDDPRAIVTALTDSRRQVEDRAMEYGQFRKFYDYARQIERRLHLGEPWEKARQDVLRLIVYANNSCVRQIAPKVFLKFMEKNVDKAADPQTSDAFLKGFLIHMESIVGFWPREGKR